MAPEKGPENGDRSPAEQTESSGEPTPETPQQADQPDPPMTDERHGLIVTRSEISNVLAIGDLLATVLDGQLTLFVLSSEFVVNNYTRNEQ